MLDRGARHFTFLGRSGCDKPNALALVQDLKRAGATVTVVKGDVANKADVDTAISACALPIGGVIQAAMGLHEALFANMTHAAWHKIIQPKWQGTWNVHNALEGKDAKVDFFLLTSSVSGSVGTATESNYCSANAFLDAFSRYRLSLGKPICSLGLGMISEVGYLHENPEIEALLLRKGIQPLSEDEFLQVVDLALAGTSTTGKFQYDELSIAHILTGLETYGIRKLQRDGFEVNNVTLEDPRVALLATSVDKEVLKDELLDQTSLPSWLAGLPSNLAATFASQKAASTLGEAIFGLVRKRFSNLILVQIDKLDDTKPLVQYGIDSMIAAEFRSWFWSAFSVDLPFADILSSTNSLNSLAVFVEERLVEG